MVSINDLSVSYGKHIVLSHLSVHLESNSIHGIVGFNGAGKTTLLNALYEYPQRYKQISYDHSQLTRKHIAYLEMEPFFYSGITGRDYLQVFQKKGLTFDIESLCAIFKVPIDQCIYTYSSGMKKKLVIAAILSLNKEIILMDEPFNGIDMESVAILQLVLRKLAMKGKTIILTSHIMESLTTICDTISLLENGHISTTYSPLEFPSLSQKLATDIERNYNNQLDTIFADARL